MARLSLAQALLATCSFAVPAFASSVLFERGTIITFKNSSQSLEALLTNGDKIEAIFEESSANITIPPGTQRISAEGKIISPGFIDTHRHGWQTSYKTLGSNTTLAEYFDRYGEFTQAGTVFGAYDVYLGQLVGIYEALNSGVTTILEHSHATFLNVNQAFLLATRSGGLVLHRPDIGVLQVGAKADIVVFDGNSPNMLGWVDPIAAIILHSHVGDINHVLVDGKWRKKYGELVLEQNRTAIEQKFLQSARRIQKIWEETPLPDLEGEYSNGIVYGSAMTVDVEKGDGTGYWTPATKTTPGGAYEEPMSFIQPHNNNVDF